MDLYLTIKDKTETSITFVPLWIRVESNSKTTFNIYEKPIHTSETKILKCGFVPPTNKGTENFLFLGHNYTINYRNKIYEGYLFFKLEDLKTSKPTEVFFYV